MKKPIKGDIRICLHLNKQDLKDFDKLVASQDPYTTRSLVMRKLIKTYIEENK